jgi:hypothetical protein
LIEVILATAILATGLVALIAATSRCLAVARRAKEYETARRLLGQVDLEIPPNFEEIKDGVETGQFGGDFADYTWKRAIEELDDEEFQLFVVRTSVTWSSRGSRSSEEVVTYVFGPTYIRGGLGGRGS